MSENKIRVFRPKKLFQIIIRKEIKYFYNILIEDNCNM